MTNLRWLLQPLVLLVCTTLVVADLFGPEAAAPEDFTADPGLDAVFPAADDAMAPTAALWPRCDEVEGNLTNSLMGIVFGEYQEKVNKGVPSLLLPLLQNVDAPTREILNSFELDTPGHTLILPKNIGTNYFDFKRRNADILTAFQIDPNTTSMETATEIIRAHLIPETVNYFDLAARTQTGLQITYTSLQGLPWTFAWQLSPDRTTGALVLLDLYLVTGTRGYFDIQADLSNTDQAKCPNAIFSVEGFLAVPAYLQTNVTLTPPPVAVPVPPPAAAPTGANDSVSAFPPTDAQALAPPADVFAPVQTPSSNGSSDPNLISSLMMLCTLAAVLVSLVC